jgi:hypothetical protein
MNTTAMKLPYTIHRIKAKISNPKYTSRMPAYMINSS